MQAWVTPECRGRVKPLGRHPDPFAPIAHSLNDLDDVEAIQLRSTLSDRELIELHVDPEEQARRAARAQGLERVCCETCGGWAILGPPVTRIRYEGGVPVEKWEEHAPRCPTCAKDKRTCRICQKPFRFVGNSRTRLCEDPVCQQIDHERRAARRAAYLAQTQQAPKEETPMPATAPHVPDPVEEPIFPELEHQLVEQLSPPAAALEPAPDARLCACGCGGQVAPGSRFLRYHHLRTPDQRAKIAKATSGSKASRTPPKASKANPKLSTPKRDAVKNRPEPSGQLCECGCGEPAKPGLRTASRSCAVKVGNRTRQSQPALPPPSPELSARAAAPPAQPDFIEQVVMLARTYTVDQLEAAANLARAARGVA